MMMIIIIIFQDTGNQHELLVKQTYEDVLATVIINKVKNIQLTNCYKLSSL